MLYEVWSAYGQSDADCIHATHDYETAKFFADRAVIRGCPDVEVLVFLEDQSYYYTAYVPVQREFAF